MNKGVVVVVAVIALAGVGVGAFVALEMGSTNGGPGNDTLTATATDGGTTTESATTTVVTATATASPVDTDTPTPVATPTQAPEIDESTLETAVLERINDRRADRGIDSLSTLEKLIEMARFHSDNMAGQRFLSHVADGYTAGERYAKYDLDDRCRIADDSNTGVRQDEELEVIGRVTVGVNGTTEAELADAAVTKWFGEAESRERLTYQNAERVGIGANVTDEGRVYLTVNLC